MTILNVDINEAGKAGVKPRIIRIETNNTSSEVQAPGFLDAIVKEGIALSETDIAFVVTKPSPSSSSSAVIVYDINFSNGKWSLIPLGSGNVGSSWVIGGNNVTAFAGTAIFGTLNDEDISFRANNEEYMKFETGTDSFLVDVGTAEISAFDTIIGSTDNPTDSVDVISQVVKLSSIPSAVKSDVVFFDPVTKALSHGLSSSATVNVQTFYTPGAATYTPTPGMKYCKVEVQGGGASGSSPNFPSSGTGGGGGGYAIGLFDAATIGASVALTIGAGGLGVVGTDGNDGGDTLFGAHITAQGGAKGIGTGTIGGGGGAALGSAYLKAFGGQGFGSINVGGFYFSGAGGASHYDFPYMFYSGSNVGGAAGVLGAGGGGAINATSNVASGTGGDGFVIVTEYI